MTSVPSLFLDRFRAVVATHGERVALRVHGTEEVTFAALHRRALGLALALREGGAVAGSIVGLLLDKSADTVVSMLAVWMAGAAFLPLDPKLPEARLAFLARDAQIAVVVAHPAHAALTLGDAVARIAPDAIGTAFAGSPLRDPTADDLAYVITTSGSTGAPKGVLVPHRGIVSLLDAQIIAFRMGPASRAILYVATSFDASISDIGTSLLSGATLCIETDEALRGGSALAALFADRGITHADLPPSLLRLLDPDAMPACLQTLIVGGEACPPPVVRRWASRFRFVNVYGPTEATVCSSLCVCDATTYTRPLVGAPLPNVTYRLLDREGRPAPDDVEAELHIGGIGLAIGYLHRPELTAEKFIAHEGERLYRTGDLVVRRAGGEIEFLGRLDRQLKLRGLRIEPEEIEAALARHSDVAHAAVVAQREGPPTPLSSRAQRLVAFVVPGDLTRPPTARALAAHLAAALPAWMLPHRYELLEEMPLGSTGKVDLAALSTRRLSRDAVATVDPSGWAVEERALADIWCTVLDLPTLDRDDDFFALGGDSLTALEIIAAANLRGLTLSPALFFASPTVRAIVAASNDATEGSAPLDGAAVSCDALRADVAHILEHLDATTPEATELAAAPSAIFMTGATGFLGARLLEELLHRTRARVACLVRCDDPDQGRRRIVEALRAQHRSLSHEALARVCVLPGDLAHDRLGLSTADWSSLATSVDAVYHAGALVNLVASYAALRDANVLGTARVLELVRRGRPKRLHHVSTLSVFVASDHAAGLMAETDELTSMRRLYGGYAQSKWAAEALVRKASTGTVASPPSIYRLGLVTGDTRSGIGAPGELLAMFLRGVASLGCVPEGVGDRLRVDVTPVDFAVEAMVRVSLAAPASSEASTFHLANPESASLRDLVRALQRFGVHVDWVPEPVFRARLGAARRDVETSAAYLALCRASSEDGVFERHRTLDLFQATGAVFGTARADAALAGSGIACPAPTDALLDGYVARILGARSPAKG